ncbi:MAG: hypothetical protein R2784_16780 [Saprospiraceae bacterium]
MPLKAVIISNGIEGLEQLYRSNEEIHYDIVEVDEISIQIWILMIF